MNKRPMANHDSKTQKSNCMDLYYPWLLTPNFIQLTNQLTNFIRPSSMATTHMAGHFGGLHMGHPQTSSEVRSVSGCCAVIWADFSITSNARGAAWQGRSPGLLNHQVMGFGSTWVRSWILIASEYLPVLCGSRAHPVHVPAGCICRSRWQAFVQTYNFVHARMRPCVHLYLCLFVPMYLGIYRILSNCLQSNI